MAKIIGVSDIKEYHYPHGMNKDYYNLQFFIISI